MGCSTDCIMKTCFTQKPRSEDLLAPINVSHFRIKPLTCKISSPVGILKFLVLHLEYDGTTEYIHTLQGEEEEKGRVAIS